MTQRDALILKKNVLAHQKINFYDRNFFLRLIEVKKTSSKLENRIGYTAGYDWPWCADHEKVFISPLKNQFLRSKFFRQKFRWKKYL